MFKMMAFSLITCTQLGMSLINSFVDHALYGTDDVMGTHHLCHCEMLQGKVSSQEVH